METDTKVPASAGGCSLDSLVSRFGALRDNAYLEYIGACRRDECLGWEAKAEHREFGLKELEAHKTAAEWLGKHRAYARTVEELTAANADEMRRSHAEREDVSRLAAELMECRRELDRLKNIVREAGIPSINMVRR
jgi:hypothetical protein